MSVYKGQEKVLNSITAVNEEKMKEIAKEVYSTNETVIGTWIDGKPIYRKVITGGTNGTVQVIYSSSTEKIIKIEGVVHSTTDGWTIPINYRDLSTISYTYVTPNGSIIFGITTNNHSVNVVNTYEIILEYTKTTD